MLAVAAAVVANLAILLMSRVVKGEFPQVRIGGDTQTVSMVDVVAVTLIVGCLAWALLALLERATGNAMRTWTALAVIVAAVSLVGPLGSGIGTASKVTLALMHLAAGAVIVRLMRRSVESRS
jgi:steroid 5-alpha reductase family enzyme